jgi:deazaflavin-dependent oxidoreductase (nitroreductase family)
MAAEHFLYLETRGRKTGRPRRIEIWFVALEQRFYIVAEGRERAGWVKNLRAHSEVAFSIGTRSDQVLEQPLTRARARVVDTRAEPALAARVAARMDAKYDWSDGLIVELTPTGSA